MCVCVCTAMCVCVHSYTCIEERTDVGVPSLAGALRMDLFLAG